MLELELRGLGVTWPLPGPSIHSAHGEGHPGATDITGYRAGGSRQTTRRFFSLSPLAATTRRKRKSFLGKGVSPTHPL